ncbi:helix-turn-helix domain-containing protein [Caldanaerobacter subterraneus]
MFITMANLSILKTGKASKVLECQPGDILEYVEDE